MNTEITDNKIGWVLYDGDCSLCTGWARRFERVLRRSGFALATLQNSANCVPATERLLRGESRERPAKLLPLPFGKGEGRGEGSLRPHGPGLEPTEMLVVTPDGRMFGGADGLVQIARRVGWAWPLFALAQVPGAMPLLRAGYRLLAANRHCFGGGCRVPGRKPLDGWPPRLLLPLAKFWVRIKLWFALAKTKRSVAGKKLETRRIRRSHRTTAFFEMP